MINKLLNKWIDFARDHIYVITLLISASLVGLMVVQFYLITVEIEVERRKFDERIEDVLDDMHDRIEDDEELSNKLIKLFRGDTNSPSAKDSLQDYLMHHIGNLTDSILEKRNLDELTYDFAFYQRIEDTLVFSSSATASQPEFQRYATRAGWRVKEAMGGELYRYGLIFHNKSWFLFYQVSSILFISAIFLALLLGSFFSAMLVLKRQKQISLQKNDFINNLTHELKTPIFASSVIFKIIKEKLQQPNYKDLDYHLSLLEKENQQLKNKVEKVLELTVLERNNPTLNWQEIDVHEVIREKIAMYQILVSAENGNLSYSLAAKKSIISGDLTHLGNIIDNLLDNAIKYCESSPKINITTTNQNGSLIMKISDNGIGIDTKDQDYIFDKFYRVSQGNLHQTKGFGLGLSYVKMMTELHGGEINLESKAGKGSIFTLTFPLLNKTKTEPHASENIISRR